MDAAQALEREDPELLVPLPRRNLYLAAEIDEEDVACEPPVASASEQHAHEPDVQILEDLLGAEVDVRFSTADRDRAFHSRAEKVGSGGHSPATGFLRGGGAVDCGERERDGRGERAWRGGQ